MDKFVFMKQLKLVLRVIESSNRAGNIIRLILIDTAIQRIGQPLQSGERAEISKTRRKKQVNTKEKNDRIHHHSTVK